MKMYFVSLIAHVEHTHTLVNCKNTDMLSQSELRSLAN